MNPTNNNFEISFYQSQESFVHPSSIVGPNVTIEKGVKIGPFCVIAGNVKIGQNSKIHSNVTIGTPAQNIGTDEPKGTVEIGENCNIREFATIGASKTETGKTSIGNNCYIMSYTHIAHDVILEDNVILINNVNLGGHVHIEKGAFLMANCAAHQFCKIGKYSALAPFSAIRQDLPPFCLFSGMPAKFFGLNLVALKRAGISQESINAIKRVTKLFYQEKLLLKDVKDLLQKDSNKNLWADKNVQHFLKFIETSDRGISRGSEI